MLRKEFSRPSAVPLCFPTLSEPTAKAWPSGEGQLSTLACRFHSVNADDARVAMFRSENLGAKGVFNLQTPGPPRSPPRLRLMGDGREGRKRTGSLPGLAPKHLPDGYHGRGILGSCL